MNRKLKGFTLVEIAIEIAMCVFCAGIIVLGCGGIVVDRMEKPDRIDDTGYKYKIHVTIAGQEHEYYTNSVKSINNGNAIKFTDKITEKTYITSQYFIEFNY